MKVAHLTSAHPRYDTRIFHKMCKSLARIEGNEIFLVVADGKGDEIKDNIQILDAGGNAGGRISRMSKMVINVFRLAQNLKVNIYHLHDPELIPIGLLLKLSGMKVIFDSHEDIPRDIKDKMYLNLIVRVLFSYLFRLLEFTVFRFFDYIVSATPDIRDKFLKIGVNSVDINNYPILEEFENHLSDSEKKRLICYVGGITKVRGVLEVVKSLELADNVRLNLVGKFESENLRNEIVSINKGWSLVNELGHLDRDGVSKAICESMVGMVTLLPANNFINSLPVKMFEYMAAKLPIIASDFQLWKSIIEDNNCGLCVNPTDINQIAHAIKTIVDNKELRLEMAENAYELVKTKYNWDMEEKKLIKLFNKLIVE